MILKLLTNLFSSLPSKGSRRAGHLFWNDLGCNHLKKSVCQKLKPGGKYFFPVTVINDEHGMTNLLEESSNISAGKLGNRRSILCFLR